LGVNYRDAGRPAEGARLMEEALRRARGRPDVVARLAWFVPQLAVAYDAACRFARSEPLYRDELERARKAFGPDGPRPANGVAVLGNNLLKQGKWSEAEPVLRACLAIREKAVPDDWPRFNTMSLLGGALLGQERYAEAEALIVPGYQGLKAHEAKI